MEPRIVRTYMTDVDDEESLVTDKRGVAAITMSAPADGRPSNDGMRQCGVTTVGRRPSIPGQRVC